LPTLSTATLGAIPGNSYLIGILLVLTLRAAKLPGSPVANILLAACSLVWNLGGLFTALLLLLGVPKESPLGLRAAALQFTAAAAWPIPLLALWRPLASGPRQRTALIALLSAAIVTAAALSAGLWAVALFGRTVLPGIELKELTAYNGALLAAGAVLILRGRLTSDAGRLATLVLIGGALAPALAILLLAHVALPAGLEAAAVVLREQSALLIVLGAFLLFARFRFADTFFRHAVRILMATLAATALALVLQSPRLADVARQTAQPAAARVFASGLLATALLLIFRLLDRALTRRFSRWVFRSPDYGAARQRLAGALDRLHEEHQVVAAAEAAARNTLGVGGAWIVPRGDLQGSHRSLEHGEAEEVADRDDARVGLPSPDVELLVPIRVGGRVAFVLAISPGPAGRGLVSEEVGFLHAVAGHLGHRLESLRYERESADQQSREARLLQQLTDAEIRALRAQINPHFLFNSLNTIADLIVTDPARAETMTLRLAKVFRHVLANSSSPLVALQEEIDFLRTYLHIEEARFGDRLRVEIDVAPEVALDQIPPLVLQPLVENALKHGLAPKPGPGRLWISARASGNDLCLRVEDDGIGPWPQAATVSGPRVAGPPAGWEAAGIGLSNVAERLRTLYRGQATVSLEARPTGGSRVTMILPRSI
jgi:two-component system, LytTR family, sensor kinase